MKYPLKLSPSSIHSRIIPDKTAMPFTTFIAQVNVLLKSGLVAGSTRKKYCSSEPTRSWLN